MSDGSKAYQATEATDLRDRIMNPNIAKSEQEWWAAREINALCEGLEQIGSISDTCVYVWTGRRCPYCECYRLSEGGR